MTGFATHEQKEQFDQVMNGAEALSQEEKSVAEQIKAMEKKGGM